jgi:DNA-binding transcriptional LysR family regulator
VDLLTGRAMSKIHYDTADLRALCELSRQGGFTRAADALFLTPSALSRRISKLEAAIGAAVVERSTRAVALTTLGAYLVSRAEPLLDSLDASIEEAARIATGHEGQIAIGCIATIAYARVPDAVDIFRKKFPEVRISLKDGESFKVTAAVLNHEVEFAVTAVVESDRDLYVEFIADDPFVFVCDHAHEWASEAAISWKQLETERLVGFKASSWTRQLLDKGTAAKNIKLSWFYETGSLTSLVGFLKSGKFVAPVPKSFATFAREMVSIPLTQPLIERKLYLVRRRDAELSAPAVAMWNAIKQVLTTSL